MRELRKTIRKNYLFTPETVKALRSIQGRRSETATIEDLIHGAAEDLTGRGVASEPRLEEGAADTAVDRLANGSFQRADAPRPVKNPRRKTVDDVLDARGGYVRGSAADTAPPTRRHRRGCKCPACLEMFGPAGAP